MLILKSTFFRQLFSWNDGPVLSLTYCYSTTRISPHHGFAVLLVAEAVVQELGMILDNCQPQLIFWSRPTAGWVKNNTATEYVNFEINFCWQWFSWHDGPLLSLTRCYSSTRIFPHHGFAVLFIAEAVVRELGMILDNCQPQLSFWSWTTSGWVKNNTAAEYVNFEINFFSALVFVEWWPLA